MFGLHVLVNHIVPKMNRGYFLFYPQTRNHQQGLFYLVLAFDLFHNNIHPGLHPECSNWQFDLNYLKNKFKRTKKSGYQ
jgi:hypothetical protein